MNKVWVKKNAFHAPKNRRQTDIGLFNNLINTSYDTHSDNVNILHYTDLFLNLIAAQVKRCNCIFVLM